MSCEEKHFTGIEPVLTIPDPVDRDTKLSKFGEKILTHDVVEDMESVSSDGGSHEIIEDEMSSNKSELNSLKDISDNLMIIDEDDVPKNYSIRLAVPEEEEEVRLIEPDQPLSEVPSIHHPKDFRRTVQQWFTEHPNKAKQTYAEHLGDAMGYSMVSIFAGLMFFVHGLFPFLFEFTGSDWVIRLSKVLQEKRKSCGFLDKSDDMDLTGEGN